VSTFAAGLDPGIQYAAGASLAEHSYFRSGGPAAHLVIPTSERHVIEVVQRCLELALPLYVLGRGSNVLISDTGLDGVVMIISDSMGRRTVCGDMITAEAGLSLSRLSAFAARNRLSGLEFAAGIPGTLGGGVLMNAGAYDSFLGDYVYSTRVIDRDGVVKEVAGTDHGFVYRGSRFSGGGAILISSTLQLQAGDETIYERMAEYQRRRRNSQPLTEISCGSAFKRPPGYFAGKLIEDAGFRGMKFGRAGVSAKHAGFIVNSGGAKSSEIAQVFLRVQDKVKEKFGVTLEPEVRFAGHFARIPEGAAVMQPVFKC
jgi:UDP-N-acetylmuramate dehydrogenase